MKEKGKTLPKRTPGGTAFKHARAYRGVYLMATPVLVAALIFYYLPMFGIRYAFFTYKGINDPIFVGMKHFVKMFSMPGFWKAFSNTLVLSITKLILNTGAAVIISVLLNELIFLKLKKVFQTIVYIPHFMSWVVAASIFSMILSPTSAGLVNDVLMKLHLITDNIYFLGDQKWWRFSYYIINVWKDTGWGTIIFMATLVIWFLQTFDLHLNIAADSKDSILALAAGSLAFLFAPMGFGDWRISTALITGFMAKESVVSTLSVLFGSTGSLQTVLTPLSAASLLVFCLLYTPCVAAIASIRRELGGKWAVFVVVGQCVIAWIAAFLVYQVGHLFI